MKIEDVHAGRVDQLRLELRQAEARAAMLVPQAIYGSLDDIYRYAAAADRADSQYLMLRATERIIDGSAFNGRDLHDKPAQADAPTARREGGGD